MANGELIDEVDLLLSKKQIGVTAAFRLMLKMQKQMYEDMAVVRSAAATLTVRVDDLERVSVVKVWQRHPKLMWALLISFVLLVSAIPARDIVQALVALKVSP